jgi:hypothetical protein
VGARAKGPVAFVEASSRPTTETPMKAFDRGSLTVCPSTRSSTRPLCSRPSSSGRAHGVVRRVVRGVARAAWSLLPVAALACSSTPPPASNDPPLGCAAWLGDQCIGAPTGVLCQSPPCSADIECQGIVTADPASLAGALASAPLGACVVLERGSYGAVSLPEGVHLLGEGPDVVSLESLHMGAGVAAGLEVRGGITAEPSFARSVLAAVRVTGGESYGVLASGELELYAVEVSGAAGGVGLLPGATATLEALWVHDVGGPGVALDCDVDCGSCGSITLASSRIERATHVGLFGAGAAVTLADVEIEETRVDGLEAASGAGVVVTQCSTLDARRAAISSNAYVGLFVDGSGAHLGDPSEERGIIIYGNVFGVWLSGVGVAEPAQEVRLEGVAIEGNEGVGLGIDGASKGIIIYGSEIRDTAARTVPVFGGGAEEVGDGLQSRALSAFVIDGLVLGGNARRSVLLDGACGEGSSLAHVTLEGGDEALGLLQQSFDGVGAPALGASVPALESSAEALFALNQAPSSVAP